MACRGKDYCGCDQALTLREALSSAWIALSASTTPKERKADAIIKAALDADYESLCEYRETLKG